MKAVILGAGPLAVALAKVRRADGQDAACYSIMGNPAYDMPGTAPAAIDGADTAAVTEVCSGAGGRCGISAVNPSAGRSDSAAGKCQMISAETGGKAHDFGRSQGRLSRLTAS